MRAERSLATARVFLAFSARLALWLDPGQVGSGWYRLLLGLYFAHSTATMFLLRSPQQSTRGFRLLVHGVDVLLTALLLPFITTVPSNPFFLFVVFVLAASAYRWGLWETVMTAVVSLSLLWMEIPSLPQHPRGIAPKLFMESVYLIVLSLLLGYLAERQKELRAERDAR